MSGFFYTREAGAEGQILTGEGAAPGVALDALLDRERPPLKAALAIGSALADLLCIAQEDQMIHGDIRPAHVTVDERGTVSLEGYGVQRRTTKAPEGRPDSHAVDVYGLGVVLHSILSAEPLGNLPKDADGHDDEVVSRVLSMDFRQVQGKRWLEDVRKFLCQIMAWSPKDRPEPLDAANVLASVAAQCPGETLEAWAARATREPAVASRATPRAVEEDLGGPVALSGPLAKGGVRQAPAAKGESTAFWSREKIAAMLAEDDDDDDEPVPRRQTVNVPASRPPEPVRSAPPVPAPPAPRAEPPRPSYRPPEEPVRAEPPRPAYRPPEAPVRSSPAQQTYSPAEEPARPPAAPFASMGNATSDPFADAEPKKTSPMVWAAVVMAVLAIGCGVVTLGGGGAWLYMGGSSADVAREEAERVAKEAEEKAAAAAKEAEAAEEKAKQEAEDAAAAAADAQPASGSRGGAKPSTSGTSTRSSTPTSTRGTTSSGTKSSAKAPSTSSTNSSAPAAPAATTTYSVKFSTPGREAKLQCGDGQTAEFAGAATMSFMGTTTCLVRIDSGKGAVQVSRTAAISCTEDAGKVTCSGG